MDQFRLALSIPELKEKFEKETYTLSKYALEKCNNNQTKAAKLLGVNRTTFIEFLKKMGHPVKRKSRSSLTVERRKSDDS